MYSESDIAGAVEAGVLTREAAEAFRNHIAVTRSTPAVDEEHFRLLTGFNDIFVAIAATLILVAVGWIGAYIGRIVAGTDFGGPRVAATAVAFGGFCVAPTSWLLSEYFTRQRRMALPSILLLFGFTGGICAGVAAAFMANAPWFAELLHIESQTAQAQLAGTFAAIAALVTAGAAWLHWRRFMVPITVAVGASAIVAVGIALLVGFVPETRNWLNVMLLVSGLLVFALAMRWDISDLERRTRRSDVAFWLHLAAAPMIAHSIFNMLGVLNGNIGIPTALLVLALYVAFAAVALAVDRRALLVSSLVYVLWAMYALFQATRVVELSAALTGLVIGSALLTLSAFWQPMRRAVVGVLGDLGKSLPPTRTATLAAA